MGEPPFNQPVCEILQKIEIAEIIRHSEEFNLPRTGGSVTLRSSGSTRSMAIQLPHEVGCRSMKRKAKLIALVLLLALLALAWFRMAGRPENLGVHNGRLAPCPNSPNCVSTQSNSEPHQIAPLAYEGSAQAAMARLKSVVQAQPRTQIVTETERYLHVEFTSALMRYVDDVEFYLDDSNKTIQFRSASRVGYGDLGANRKRMELLRREFLAAADPLR